MGSQLHVGLKMFQVITNQLSNNPVLLHDLVCEDLDLILQSFDLPQLGHLHHDAIIGMSHTFLGL